MDDIVRLRFEVAVGGVELRGGRGAAAEAEADVNVPPVSNPVSASAADELVTEASSSAVPASSAAGRFGAAM